jgi:acetyl-CoA carboxylase, biotin carboxylase subunit
VTGAERSSGRSFPTAINPLHQKLLDDPEFQARDYAIKWLEEWLERDGG